MITITAVSNQLAQLSSSLRDLGEEALDHGVTTALEVADPRTPVDTGALRSNISVERGAGSRTITWNQSYSAYLEFGTSRGIRAHGFASAGASAGLEAIDAHLRTWGG